MLLPTCARSPINKHPQFRDAHITLNVTLKLLHMLSLRLQYISYKYYGLTSISPTLTTWTITDKMPYTHINEKLRWDEEDMQYACSCTCFDEFSSIFLLNRS